MHYRAFLLIRFVSDSAVMIQSDESANGLIFTDFIESIRQNCQNPLGHKACYPKYPYLVYGIIVDSSVSWIPGDAGT